MQLRVFLSYAREDRDRVARFASRLTEPLEPWIDSVALQTGDDFAQHINTTIRGECEFFAVFLSAAALASTWVAQELEWALSREQELAAATPFVLPIALEPVLEAPGFPESLRARHLLEWLDASDSGLAASMDELRQALFVHLARHFALTQPSGPALLLDRFEADLLEFKRVAFRLQATLRDSVSKLSQPDVIDEFLVPATNEYNAFSREFVARLPEYARRVRARWGVNLGEDCLGFTRFVEEEVFRGQVFALNEARADLHRYTPAQVDAKELASMDRRKDKARKKVQAALDDMTVRGGELLRKLRREL